jgi:hypothetical protein
MPVSLLEVLRSIPDHRRREGKRFDLATVLLCAILAVVAGANPPRRPLTSGCMIVSRWTRGAAGLAESLIAISSAARSFEPTSSSITVSR